MSWISYKFLDNLLQCRTNKSSVTVSAPPSVASSKSVSLMVFLKFGKQCLRWTIELQFELYGSVQMRSECPLKYTWSS